MVDGHAVHDTEMGDVLWLDAVAQADLVRRRQVKAEELVDAARARVQALAAMNAVVAEVGDRPPRLDAPLTGVPFLVKDLLLEVAGTPLTAGSRWLAGHVSRQDTELAVRYRRAGLVLVGKTNTCEFGLSPTVEPALHGPTRNPWDPGRSPGGSSGGSAAAVAAGLVPAAHGNDLGGSLRYPAAWCGVFGLKPTRGRTSLGPGLGEGLSGRLTEHVVTRSVRDSAVFLDAVSGPARGEPPGAPPPRRPFLHEVGTAPGRLRVAVTTRPRNGQPVDPAWASAAEQAAALLEQLGHVVEEGSPDGLDDPDYDWALGTVYGAAVGWMLGHWCRRLGRPPADGEVEPQTRAYWESARRVTAVDYLLAGDVLQRVSRSVSTWFQTYDAWLTPTLGGGPAPLGELVGTEAEPLRGSRSAGRYLMFDAELANVTGNPAMSVPFGLGPAGHPVGIHVLGRYADEVTLFRLAAQLESARPWAHLRPPSVLPLGASGTS